MDKIEIKELTLEDIPDYVKVNTLAWQESYKGLIADSILDEVLNNVEDSIQKQINKFDNDKKNNIKKFVFKVNNEAVGMTGIGKSTYEKYEDIGELYSLYLLNKVKKKEYGKMLFYHDVKELIGLGFNSMVIGCLVNNPANNFYKHMGGKLIEVVTKKIKENDITWAHGNPTFFFVAEGTDLSGAAHRYEDYVTFVPDNYETDGNGYATVSVTLRNIPLGQYTIWEKPVLRYYLKDVWADTENVRITKKAEAAYGKDPKETAVGTAALTVEKPDAALTFLNEKARYDKFSHTDCIKNTIPLLFS